MLFELKYEPQMRVVPQIEITSYITNFGHKVTWVLFSDEINKIEKVTFKDACVFVIPRINKKGVLKLIYSITYDLRKICFLSNEFKKGTYNMVFARNTLFNGVLALYLKFRYRVPFIFEIANPLEQYFESYISNSKHKSFWHIISIIYSQLILQVLKTADLVLPTTKWMEEYFVEKGLDKLKMMPYPNGIDPNRFSVANNERDINEIQVQYNLKNRKIIIYIGAIDKLRKLDVLIRSFSKLTNIRNDIKLIMVGKGNDQHNLEKLTKDLRLEDYVVFTGQVDPNLIPKFIAAADIGICPVPPFDFYKLSSPIKLFEYMAMGKPIVANIEIPEQKEVVEECGCGILVEFEEQAFANGILELLDCPDKARAIGANGLEWVKKNRSFEYLASKVEKRYCELLDPNLNTNMVGNQ